MTFIWFYFGVLNIIGFIIMGIDKQRAKQRQYRISETTLWIIALVGGAIGSTVGMQFFRHKTKHKQFKWGFPVVAVLDIILLLKFV